MKKFLLIFYAFAFTHSAVAQGKATPQLITAIAKKDSIQELQLRTAPSVLYGTSSYYHNMFEGRQTANGEIFRQSKMTAACNVLPLGTWIRVTNLRNNRSVIVKVNDRLHPRMTRVTDLSRSAAEKLKFTGAGLTRVKVEVLGRTRPQSDIARVDK